MGIQSRRIGSEYYDSEHAPKNTFRLGKITKVAVLSGRNVRGPK